MISSLQTTIFGERPRIVCRGRRAVDEGVWREASTVADAERDSLGVCREYGITIFDLAVGGALSSDKIGG